MFEKFKTGIADMQSLRHPMHVPVLDWVMADIIHLPREACLIVDGIFPEPALAKYPVAARNPNRRAALSLGQNQAMHTSRLLSDGFHHDITLRHPPFPHRSSPAIDHSIAHYCYIS